MYYTSYFGNIRHIDRATHTLAVVTQQKPSFCDSSIEDWSFLGPDKDLLLEYKHGIINEKEYTECYINKLNLIWDSIENYMIFNKDRNVVFLCYEKPPKFCHRHLLAEFLKEKGFECEELDYAI